MSDEPGFHYKRDERLSMRSAPRPTGPHRGFFRGNRGAKILLFNLVLIAALFVLYGRSMVRSENRAELAGLRLTLQGAAEADDVLAILEVRAAAPAASAASAPGQRLFVVFRAGDADLRFSQVLPAPGSSIAISGRLLAAGQVRELVAEVSVGEKRVVLRRAIARE